MLFVYKIEYQSKVGGKFKHKFIHASCLGDAEIIVRDMCFWMDIKVLDIDFLPVPYRYYGNWKYSKNNVY